MKNNKKKIIAVCAIVLAVLLVAFGIIYFATRPAAQKGAKTIDFSVVLSDGNSKDYKISTDAEFLRQALEEQNLIKGDESEFGLFVTSVDGVEADGAKEEWWCFTQDGQMLMTGVDTTPVADGDKFEATLTVGYDMY